MVSVRLSPGESSPPRISLRTSATKASRVLVV